MKHGSARPGDYRFFKIVEHCSNPNKLCKKYRNRAPADITTLLIDIYCVTREFFVRLLPPA
jgi:hypothetical protein